MLKICAFTPSSGCGVFFSWSCWQPLLSIILTRLGSPKPCIGCLHLAVNSVFCLTWMVCTCFSPVSVLFLSPLLLWLLFVLILFLDQKALVANHQNLNIASRDQGNYNRNAKFLRPKESNQRMIDVNDLRKGVTFTVDNNIYKVLEYSHNKPGRGNATIRTTLRDLRTGATIQRTFTSGDRVQDIRVDSDTVEYLYNDGEFLHFMDITTYDQHELRSDVFGDDVGFLRENMQLKLSSYDGEIIDYELPTTVEHKIIEAENAIAGDTATGATKKVITETGLKVTVPLFVNVGDTIRVDTRDGSYITRV